MALYHTHRPQTFASVIGQDHIIRTITNQILKGTVAHAYLFSGPRGVGKTTTARLIAKAVNVPLLGGSAEPDNSTPEAQEISSGKSIDVIEIDAASHTGVDHVREHIIENAQFKPTKLKRKVFIIDEVHMLSTSAFNALLKTLEEPPAHVMFILATTELHKLPATIISRCQQYQFSEVPHTVMKEHLAHIAKEEGVKVDEAVLSRLAAKSGGCVRDGVSLLEQIMATGEKHITEEAASLLLPPSARQETLNFVTALIQKDASAALETLHQLSSNGTHLGQFADDVLSLMRSLMILQTGSANAEKDLYDAETLSQIQGLTTAIGSGDLISLIDVTLRRRNMMKHAPIAELPLEMLAVEWAAGNAPAAMPANASPTPTPAAPNKNTQQKQETPAAPAKQEEKPKTEEKPEPQAEITAPEPAPAVAEPSEAPKAVEEESAPPPASGSLDLSKVKKGWQQVISKLEKESPSLIFILRDAQIMNVTGNTITIGVEFGFHKDKLLEMGCKTSIQTIMSEIYGMPTELDAVIAAPQGNGPSAAMQDLAASFGGTVS